MRYEKKTFALQKKERDRDKHSAAIEMRILTKNAASGLLYRNQLGNNEIFHGFKE
jgi:hypothetical protein